MRRVAGALALVLAAACSPAPAPEPQPAADTAAPAPEAAPVAEAAPPPAPVDEAAAAWERRLGNLPPDAADVIGRIDACAHFSGEFNGDGSERDREVAARMDELRCDSIETDAAALRDLYGDRPDVMEALDLATGGRP